MKVRKLIPFQAPSCLLIAVVLSSLALGESTNARVGPVGSEVSTQELASKLLKRSVKYRVTLPVRYKSLDKERFPVIYLLHGLFGHFDNWTDKTKLAEYVA